MSDAVTVHVLHYGWTLCHSLHFPPGEWPSEHKWISLAEVPSEPHTVTCTGCRAASAVNVPALEAVGALLAFIARVRGETLTAEAWAAYMAATDEVLARMRIRKEAPAPRAPKAPGDFWAMPLERLLQLPEDHT